MRRRPPRSTRTDTLLPYTTLFRSAAIPVHGHFRNGGFLRDLYPLVPYRFTVRSAHDNSRGSGLLTCTRPIASRMLDVDEECCQIGRIGKTCDLAAHRTDQTALRILGRQRGRAASRDRGGQNG